jgi:hypothetical protein
MLWANSFLQSLKENVGGMFANQCLGKFAAPLLAILVAISITLAQATGRASAATRSPSSKAMDIVYLNHFFLTLDAESYSAIKSSSFLRDEFAPFEQRTTVRQDTTYTGSYFYGVDTYFEFFEAGRGLGRMTGASAIAFGVETFGASQRLKPQLEAAFAAPVAVRPITRRVNDHDVDWFYMTTVEDKSPSPLLQWWVMEYRDSFLNNWYSDLSPSTRGIKRAEILERYAAKLGEKDHGQHRLLENVVEITLALPDAERAQLLKTCETFGYRVTTDHHQSRCEGPQITFIVNAPKNTAQGITAVKFSLRRAKQGEKTYHFGKTVLQFNDDRTAVWTF